ncbi:reverse transcriptase [Ascosphaera apis ARSEF 7405]|uniref:Reverse transcriptase n=1 Tax=Ascosphaera apis ARSEF 7405 TaxID=392613 RepID=A0A167W8D1_9EURO|nr:reverse transcriptase [Ascosphaera apis ARSEF 7405]
MEEFASTADICRFTRWRKRTFPAATPPLKDPGSDEWVEDTEAKQELLFRTFTNPGVPAEDQLEPPNAFPSTLPFPDITRHEVRQSVLETPSTAPGMDGIPVSLLKVAWPLVEDRVFHLFCACLKLGHHPDSFRKARVVVLSKPGDRDRSTPRSYRPISLLSTLGKGLERLVARRLSYVGLEHGIFGSQQFGALPRRSAVDLTSCLVRDVDFQFRNLRVASLLTLDIQGAYDAIFPGRLRRRLAEQGWPKPLVDWVFSFASDRSVALTLDGHQSRMFKAQRGLPQGSPISPVLFLLYTAPLHHLALRSSSFGYVDDVALLARGTSVEDTVQDLAADVETLLTWAKENAVSFDPKKSELLHFTRKRRPGTQVNPGISLPATADRPAWAIDAVPRDGCVRWLGVWFDRGMTFIQHIRRAKSKALGCAGTIQGMGRMMRGTAPRVLQRVVRAAILPIFLYASSTWWPVPDAKHHRAGGRTILQATTQVLRAAGKAVLPVWRTSPTAAILREAGLPTAHSLLQYHSASKGLSLKDLMKELLDLDHYDGYTILESISVFTPMSQQLVPVSSLRVNM